MSERDRRQGTEDGYRLWLRYERIADERRQAEYCAALSEIVIETSSPSLLAAKKELAAGLEGLLGTAAQFTTRVTHDGTLLAGTSESSPQIAALNLQQELRGAGDEGFVISRASVAGRACHVIAANRDIGVLYGVFHLLRQLQMQKPLGEALVVAPRVKHRMLNHWDNLDRTVERGYAGFSLWDWHKLPDYLDPRYEDYARANASIGINATVVTNVNADALVLTPQYLKKVAALAEVFRPYGIRVFLTARFSAPLEIGGLTSADPLAPDVAGWWKRKADEIYEQIPDFGGFVVKANSEGQPGPEDYARTHADGANVLADALGTRGMVIWRAFVYSERKPDDRAKQAFAEFVPLDAAFRPNVWVQVKNGPIDFQPREPFHPLFGAMRTPLMLEFQITQEYLGFATHLAFLAPLFEEVLDQDTYSRGPGSTVGKLLEGVDGNAPGGVAGVANIGTERNWCGHPFAAANWYAFGRLAWDHTLGADQIAEEWIRMTFSNDPRLVEQLQSMMLGSREAVVSYMTPLGLHHLMARNHHYGPAPWHSVGREDWTSTYYHRADTSGIGFDRTSRGSNAIAQYPPPLRERFESIESCPETFLLWFHHVPWQHRMQSGRTLWDELCYKYQAGVDAVRDMQRTWRSLARLVDQARFEHVEALLRIQEQEARWWRDACILYFQTFSGLPIPSECETPEASLAHYMEIRHRYVPGIPDRGD